MVLRPHRKTAIHRRDDLLDESSRGNALPRTALAGTCHGPGNIVDTSTYLKKGWEKAIPCFWHSNTKTFFYMAVLMQLSFCEALNSWRRRQRSIVDSGSAQQHLTSSKRKGKNESLRRGEPARLWSEPRIGRPEVPMKPKMND
jgi:hypothetical protein